MSGFPQFTVAPIDPKTGRWNREWYLFMQAMWERQGGTSDITEAEANGLPRSRRGSTRTPDSVTAGRPHLPRRQDEVAPLRHAFPQLLLTKEAYKPLTLIRLYTGLTADIPAGWQLADGTNSTPDMRDKFVIGSGAHSTGSSGGSTTITTDNLPAHTHPYNDMDTTYSANTVAVQSGSGTTVVQSLTAGGGDIPRTTGSNTTAGTPYLPPYYAVAYIINTKTVTIVTDAKLR